MAPRPSSGAIVFTVFIALVLDLLAFTLPLPLFPRLTAWYLDKEAQSSDRLLSKLLSLTHAWRSTLLSFATSADGIASRVDRNWDVVLLGGAMGSLFSLCQSFISPYLGRLSDKYGRKTVLLTTMLGNIASALIWLKSTSFSTFLLSRLVGGLSEGNVQLSTAIISDVTPAATRSKSLALVGIAFSICFTVGPSLGAYFASRPLAVTKPGESDKWNVYATPAAISLGLLVSETIYLAIKLPETRKWVKEEPAVTTDENKGEPTVAKDPAVARLARLTKIGWFHCSFLLFFSGAEFTLTFLTYDLFGATNAQNGRLLSYIGVLAACLQARHVRPTLAQKGGLKVASTGLVTSALAFYLLALLALPKVTANCTLSTIILYSAATCLAYVSATVVTGLTVAAAACCDEDTGAADDRLKRGRALGVFRSKGQLGRAIGPLLASSVYWLFGPSLCYLFIAIAVTWVTVALKAYLGEETKKEQALKTKLE